MSAPLLLFIQLVFLVTFATFAVFAFFYFLSIIIGAPYVPTPQKYIDIMFEFANLKKGESFMDLGCGDGRVVIAAAKIGAKAYGVEINPFLYLLSKFNIQKNGVGKGAQVFLSNLYSVDFSKYDIIFVAGFMDMMGRIEEVFNKKVKKGTRVICYPFPLPHKKAVKIKTGIYKYIY
ncbi:50S ribosomal protein L11 methyltransferase [Candidatus Gottesmanbacteria bacterium]|nr:50S ribosomal protein L11 methyltransferase [Candidatus Gottesmanbacteria bacterium]